MSYKKSNLPEIGIGTWALAGDYWGEQNHSDSLKMIHAATRLGFNLFDTSPDYGKGKSEQLLGQQLPDNSNQNIITTKCFIKPNSSIEKSIKNSLNRLNRDYIDYFFIHWPSTKVDSKPMMELLEEYRSNNIIKYIGVSNFNLNELQDIQRAGKVDIVQNAYNFFWDSDESYFKYCKKHKILTQAYAPLAQGLLTGKFNKLYPYVSKDSRYKMSLYSESNLKIIYIYIEALMELADKNNLMLSELALKWTLSKEFIDSIVVGCRNRKQVEALKKINNIVLQDEIIKEMDLLSYSISKELKKGNNIFNHSY